MNRARLLERESRAMRRLNFFRAASYPIQSIHILKDLPVHSSTWKGSKMSSGKTMEWISKSSPRFKARIAGVFYLLNAVTYGYAYGHLGSKFLAAGNAAATANNILANETLLRICFAAEIVACICYIVVTLLLYDLFKPVSRSISLLAAFFSLAGCAVGALGSLFIYAPLLILNGEPYLSVFKLEQLQALALFSLNLHNVAADISMVLFGVYCILIGTLILRSTFMPRIIGAFMALAGLGYLTFLSPPLAQSLFPHVLTPAGALGEFSLLLWLLIFGVNSQRWKQQAAAAVE
jgi:hypothetical protein